MSLVWISDDGSDWRLVEDLETFGPSGLTAIAADETATMLAVGYAVQPPPGDGPDLYLKVGRAWRSTNGVDWVAVDAPDGIYADVVHTSSGWYVGGASSGSPVIWHSSDLGGWATTQLGGTGSIEHLAVGADGTIVAVGCIEPSRGAPCESVAWAAHAGTGTWQQAAGTMRSVTAVVGWRDGFAAIGSNAEGTGATSWISSDGLRWEAGPAVDGAQGWALLPLRDILLLGGEAFDEAGNAQAGLWASPDGLTWQSAAVMAQLPSQVGGRLSVLFDSGDALVGLGTGFVDGRGAGLLFLAP
jgi:hypothetical protein